MALLKERADAAAKTSSQQSEEVSTATAAKVKCPVTRKDFEEHSKPLVVTIDGKPMTAEVQRQKDGTVGFSTGSLGWRSGEKITIMIDGKPCKAQVGLNIMLVGSKELPK